MSIWYPPGTPPPVVLKEAPPDPLRQADPFKAAIERDTERIAAAVPVARAIVDGRKAELSLSHLRNLAARNRERLERIVKRAQELDQRGEAAAQVSEKVFEEHEAVFKGIHEQLDEVDKFNSEMKAQLGNSQ